MLSPDMMGQAAPPPEMDQGPPPGVLDALMGGGGQPPPDQMPPDQAPPEMSPESMSPEDNVRMALEHLQAAMQAEPDDADSQKLAKVVQALYEIFSGRQKEQQQLMGGGNMRALSRAYGAQ